MNVLVLQIRSARSGARVSLRSGQWITIGASERADFCIRGEAGLPGLCAKLEVRDKDCLVSDISPTRPVLVVRGAPTGMAILKNGDTFQVGQAELQVQWDVAGVTSEAPAVTPAEKAPAIVRDCREERMASGLRKWWVDDGAVWPMLEVLSKLARTRPALLFVNGRAGGSRTPSWLLQQEDLFQQAPDEIRKEHSLHLLSDLPLQKLWETYEPLDRANCAIWAFADIPKAQVLADVKLVLGWFARPSILEMTLQHGSPNLIERLVKPFSAFCVHPSNGLDWVVYGKPGLTRESLGF